MDEHDFGAFLRARRDVLSPHDAGLPVSGDRRVHRLRREEVARLAGVSTDYYTRLEQGRERRPSDQAMDAIARALQLDEAAAAHSGSCSRDGSAPGSVDQPVRMPADGS